MAALSNSRSSHLGKYISSTAKTKSRDSEVDGLLTQNYKGSCLKAKGIPEYQNIGDMSNISDDLGTKIAELQQLKGHAATQLSKESQKIESSVAQVIFDLRKWQTHLLGLLDKEFSMCLTAIKEQLDMAVKFKAQADSIKSSPGSSSAATTLLLSLQTVKWLDENTLKFPHVVFNWDKNQPRNMIFFESTELSDSYGSIDAPEDFRTPLTTLMTNGMTAVRRQLVAQDQKAPPVKDIRIDTQGLGQSGFFGEESHDLSLFEVPVEMPEPADDSSKKSQANSASKQQALKSVIAKGVLSCKNLKSRPAYGKGQLKQTSFNPNFGIPKMVSKTCLGTAQFSSKGPAPTKPVARAKQGHKSIEKPESKYALARQLSSNKSYERLTCPASTHSQLMASGSMDLNKSSHRSSLRAPAKVKAVIQMKPEETDDIYYEYLRGKLSLGKNRGVK